MSERFFGKYRGMCMNNIDPMQMGRIQAQVPDVAGLTPTTWAMPCVPLTGKSSGTWFVPQIGTGVWIEFEQGDPDYPIWTGCFWGSASDTPSDAKAQLPASPSIVMQTALAHHLTISDLPGPTGGIILKSATGASITVNDIGITIDNGKGAKIEMIGPKVTINNGALQVI
jgi:uncharacterized protein involved in type VI secretion and phage assembly